jgi:hypothetical protein
VVGDLPPHRKGLAMFSRKKIPTGFRVSVYAISPELWRWEIRYEDVLLRCGTSRCRKAAEQDVAAELDS